MATKKKSADDVFKAAAPAKPAAAAKAKPAVKAKPPEPKAPEVPADSAATVLERAAEKMAAAMMGVRAPKGEVRATKSRVDGGKLAAAKVEAMKAGPVTMYLSKDRYLQQWGEDRPSRVAASPSYVVPVQVPAKIARGGHNSGNVEIIDHPEDDYLSYTHPGKPVDAQRPQRLPATPVPGGPVA